MNKIFGMLGLARRAGKVSTGTSICEKTIKSNTAKLAWLAEDASENSKKIITDACSYAGIRLIQYGTMSELGHFTGAKADRAAVSVNDNNFAKAILDIYNTLIQTEKG